MPKPTAKDAAGGKDRWGAPSLSPTDILRGLQGDLWVTVRGEEPDHAWGPGAQSSTPRSWPVVTPFLSCSSPRAASLTPGPGAAGPGHRRERREKTSGNTDEEPQRCSALLSRMRPELDGRLRGAPRTPALVPGIPAASNARPSALPASQSASAASPSYDERHSALCFLCFLPMATAPRAAASPAAPWPPTPGPGSPPASPRSLRDRAGSGRRDRK